MKKFMWIILAAVTLLAFTGCGSMRTPSSGANKEKVWYNTFYGISIESAIFGDGIIVK